MTNNNEYESPWGKPGPTPPPTRYDLRILQSLRRIIRAVDLHSRRLSAEYKITGPQLVCLMVVDENGACNVGEIARTVYLSASTVVGILDRLEEKGLIVRERDARDRRVVNVSATEKGKELVRRAPSPLQDTLAKALKTISEDEQKKIDESLNRIIELMEARDIDASPILDTGHLNPDPGK